MRIVDDGIIIGQKKLGENGIILTIFSKENGIVRGLCKISKKKNKPLLMDKVFFNWKSRLKDGLGFINFEIQKSFFIYNEKYTFNLLRASASELCLKLLPQNEINSMIYYDLINLIEFDIASEKDNHFHLFKYYILWEIKLLNNLGYGFDFSKCAVSGDKNLAYVSPRTGQVVSEEVGRPWKEKLLKLPKFLYKNTEVIEKKDIEDAFILNKFFFDKIIDGLSHNKKIKFIYREELIKNIK